jgi:hypothetical protein
MASRISSWHYSTPVCSTMWQPHVMQGVSWCLTVSSRTGQCSCFEQCRQQHSFQLFCSSQQQPCKELLLVQAIRFQLARTSCCARACDACIPPAAHCSGLKLQAAAAHPAIQYPVDSNTPLSLIQLQPPITKPCSTAKRNTFMHATQLPKHLVLSCGGADAVNTMSTMWPGMLDVPTIRGWLAFYRDAAPHHYQACGDQASVFSALLWS